VPAYIVFTDATLIDMCLKLPKNEIEFLRITGVGQQKCEKYSKVFLEVIQKHYAKNPVAQEISEDSFNDYAVQVKRSQDKNVKPDEVPYEVIKAAVEHLEHTVQITIGRKYKDETLRGTTQIVKSISVLYPNGTIFYLFFKGSDGKLKNISNRNIENVCILT